MPFIDRIRKYTSLSIVGLEKNTGKTECLNYVLRRMAQTQTQVAVTSIGIDGERVDLIKSTPKPEIYVEPGMYFTTLSRYYLEKRFCAEICEVDNGSAVSGGLVTARALERGKIILAGPSDTVSLARWVEQAPIKWQAGLALVDGALSRMSLASPAVTQAMILTTGAAYSANMTRLLGRTRFVYDTLCLPAVPKELAGRCGEVVRGVWAVDERGELKDLGIHSALRTQDVTKIIHSGERRIFIPGVVSNTLLDKLGHQKEVNGMELIIRDFSRLFTEPDVFYRFLKEGGKISTVLKTNLIAVCVNPWSPEGYHLNATELETRMQEVLELPVYNIKRLEQ